MTAPGLLGASGLALGGTGLAQHPRGAANAAELVDAAWADGVRFFDTAPMYGGGRSEQWLGAALSAYPREEYRLSSKAGRLVRRDEPVRPGESDLWRFDFSPDGIRRSVEESLLRLGTDHLDLVLLHDPDEVLDQAVQQSYPVLQALRDEGVVRAVGVGVTRVPTLLHLLRSVEVEVALLAGRLSLVDDEAVATVLPLVADQGVALLVASALHAGLVDGQDSGQYHYAPTPPAVVRQVAAIRAVCDRWATPIAAVALRLVLALPEVALVLTGAADVGQWHENLGWARFPVPSGLWWELAGSGLLAVEVPVSLLASATSAGADNTKEACG